MFFFWFCFSVWIDNIKAKLRREKSRSEVIEAKVHGDTALNMISDFKQFC